MATNAIGGDCKEIAYSHPVYGTGVLLPKANESFTLNLGGYRRNDDANGVAGDGSSIDQINQVRWSISGPIANDTRNRMELEKLVQMAGHPDHATWTITHINGSIYRGTGAPVGELDFDMNTAMLPIKISGGGDLVKQA